MMKDIDTNLKKGDRIRVKVCDASGTATKMRLAEVIAIKQILTDRDMKSYALVHYLDEGNVNYECVPLEWVERLSDEENNNY